MASRASNSVAFVILDSVVDDDARTWACLDRSVRRRTASMSEDERAWFHELLYPDLFSEYDARFLSAYVRTLPIELSAEFRECERAWGSDEALHYKGFRVAYGAVFDRNGDDLDAEMATRESGADFEALADLFEDEFSIACLLAYDELATVRAYRANREGYARLGPEMKELVRQVTADEGRHYRNFFNLVRTKHSDRLGDVDATIARIRDREGVSYRNTFVLDHDDDVWSEELFDESAAVLRRHLHV